MCSSDLTAGCIIAGQLVGRGFDFGNEFGVCPQFGHVFNDITFRFLRVPQRLTSIQSRLLTVQFSRASIAS